MAIIQSLPKPIRPKINFGNPITQGLVFDAPFFEGSGLNALDLRSNNLGSIANAPVWEKKRAGTCLTFADNTNQVIYTSTSPQNSLSKVSIEFLCFPTGENVANDARAIHKGPKYFSMAYASTNKFEFASAWTTTEGDWDTPVFAANNLYHVIATYDYGSTSNNPIIYVNGISQTVTRISTPVGSAPTDNTSLILGNRSASEGSTKGFVGDIYYVRYWNRILIPTEAFSLYLNPWQIYVNPNPGQFYTAPVAVAATTYQVTWMSMGMGM